MSGRCGGWSPQGAVLRRWVVCLLAIFATQRVWALRIGEVAQSGFGERAAAFFTRWDEATAWAVVGCTLVGLCCGVMGGFLVVRRLALLGDTLSHAVLPGVAAGFLWTMRKDAVAIFVGAVAAALLGAGVMEMLRRTTRHKEDAALGFVLAAFFGLGVCLFTMIQNLPVADKAGLNAFLFGQAAAIGPEDVGLMGAVTALVLLMVTLFYHPLRLAVFDEEFARASGLPVRALFFGLMVILSFSVVASLQAAGVVLVTAMLVVPAVTALFFTERFGVLLILGGLLGAGTGFVGAFLSYSGRNLPTGPVMVITAAGIFVLALVFTPRRGLLAKFLERRASASRAERENLLKRIYQILERDDFTRRSVRREELHAAGQARRGFSTRLRDLRRRGFLSQEQPEVGLSQAGLSEAREVVRRHRLWEAYLTQEAGQAPDHVHDAAEVAEHLLDDASTKELEEKLGRVSRDPHGREIPGRISRSGGK